ncbi:shootin-1 [Pectinophora gossypiella]|nr:shootin-1 [Pectinophora gossypiella]XP_049880637.1 shootin-1 [Pectinophora gossypiella]XP_049880638.1 shootin-1 [Pectinophora gossypiella]
MIKRNGDNVFAIASSHNQCQGGKSAVPLFPAGGGGGGAGTRIPRATPRMTPPDAHHNTKEANIALSTYVEKWKNRYEEAERKHKAHLLKQEKARREHDDLQRRYNILHEERNHLDLELREREKELNKLRTVSEKLFTEYQQLKHQSEVDAGLMQKVMQQAGEWYKQNKQLKRRSTVLLSALPNKPIDLDLDCTDTASDTSSNEEVDFLKQQLSSLSQQLAALQTENNAAKLTEFETHEQCVALAQELEQEKEKCQAQEKELEELRSQIERHNRVSKLLMEEVTALKDNADKDREMAETYKSEALSAKKRVKQLSHQSALLMGELEMDERLMLLLGEVDSLKLALDSQASRHRDQLEELQLKLAEKHEDTDILLWEEKIRLAEEDAQKALERAERAEKRLIELERVKVGQKKSGIMSRISYFENGGAEKNEIKEEKEIEEVKETLAPVSAPPRSPSPSRTPTPAPISPTPPPPPTPPMAPPPPPPCLPPPPPPPPPPPAVFSPAGEVDDMAKLLAGKQGTLKKTKQANGGGAIDAIVDQIKGGKFHLKSTDQNFLEKKPKEEQPEAVKEMLAILGTLRKRRSVTRPSFVGSSDA